MNFQDSLLLIPATIGPIFIILGFVMLKFPPKKINSLYGYRTKSSMKSQERWDFSQKFSAKEMMKWGCFLTLTSLLGLIFNFSGKTEMIVGLILMFIAVFLILSNTEKALQKNFGKE